MALVIKDRVKETTTTTGTGTYTLAGAEVGFQSFSTIGDGNTTYYAVTNNNDWEVGIGTYTASGTTLARTTILSSSNSNNAVNWSSGEKYVIVTQPSSKASFLDASGDLNISGDIVVSGTVDGRDIATNIPASLGTAGQVLTVNSGASAGEWADAGGADLYAANESNPTAQPSATGANAIAIGDGAIASGQYSIALGWGQSSGTEGVSIAIDSNSTNFGAKGVNSIAMGKLAVASNTSCVAIGQSASASTNNSIALGVSSVAAGLRATALTNSYASGEDSFAAAIANNTSSYGASGANSVAIGRQAKSTAAQSLALGWAAQTSGNGRSTAIGYLNQASSFGATALGYQNQANGDYSTAIGRGTNVNADNSVGIGYQADTSTNNQIVLGGTSQQVKISSTYTLPTADGTNGQVLTTDGSGAVTFADAGGGADLYAANESSPAAQPSATGANAIAIGDSAVASGADALAFGDGTTSSSTRSTAIGYNSTSSGIASVAIGANANSSQFYSVAIGSPSNGTGSVATGGASAIAINGRASGTDSLAAAIASNSSSYGASGTSSVAIGYQSKATALYSASLGGYQNTSSSSYAVTAGSSNIASATRSIAIGGHSNEASGGYSAILGGMGNTASGSYSRAGGYFADTQNIDGKDAYASYSFSNDGDQQRASLVLFCDTTDATAEALRSNTSTAGTTNQVVLPNNSCYGFTGTVIAREDSSATNDFAIWEIKGGAVRGASASTTALGTYNINKISESAGATNWSIALSADTTNGAVAITVTGEASHNIRWVATVNTTEVTY